MYHLAAYTVINAGAATFADMTAATDTVFTTRNGHLIFTEDYQLLADFVDGATATRARYQAPTWNAIGEAHLWPMNTGAAVVPSNPQVARYYSGSMPKIPQNEELQVQLTVTAAETDFAALWIAPMDWSRQMPGGIRQTICVRATGAVAKTLNSWSGGGVLTLASNLRGGVYVVLGAECFCANALFFRMIFPRTPTRRRQMRPGGLCMNALTDVPLMSPSLGKFEWGAWGFFHTFELPQIEVFGNVAGAATQEIRLWLGYLGESESLLDAATA